MIYARRQLNLADQAVSVSVGARFIAPSRFIAPALVTGVVAGLVRSGRLVGLLDENDFAELRAALARAEDALGQHLDGAHARHARRAAHRPGAGPRRRPRPRGCLLEGA